jgi:hypothetical protein
MTFEEVLEQAIAMLQRRGRLTYRTLKRQFHLDDEALDDLKVEIIKGQRLGIDEDGEVLVWTGAPAATAEPLPAPQTAAPMASGAGRNGPQGNSAATARHLRQAHTLFTTLQAPAYVERTAQLARDYGMTLPNATPATPAQDKA